MIEKESLFSEERKQKILELINQKEKVTVAQLCQFFGMSSATIRNDLKELENTGLLKRTHGGAIANAKISFELDTEHKEQQFIEEKQKIAQTALSLIDDGDTVILDTGTTTLELAKLLDTKRALTVLTNDLKIALCLEEYNDINILFIGGFIKKKFHCTVGLIGNSMLSNLVVDKAFMGTNGFTLSNGATTPDIHQGEMKKSMISIANKVIVLCDSSKIGTKLFYQFASAQEIDTLVTDSHIDTETKDRLELEGIEVIYPQG